MTWGLEVCNNFTIGSNAGSSVVAGSSLGESGTDRECRPWYSWCSGRFDGVKSKSLLLAPVSMAIHGTTRRMNQVRRGYNFSDAIGRAVPR